MTPLPPAAVEAVARAIASETINLALAFSETPGAINRQHYEREEALRMARAAMDADPRVKLLEEVRAANGRENDKLWGRIAALEARVARLTKALEEISNHWANSYDHPYANNEMYRGPYGIGIVDGHRACTIIANAALAESSDKTEG